MAVQKSIPMERIISGVVLKTSEICIVSDTEYITNGESVIVTKIIDNCTVYIDNENTDHVIIKALTNTKIKPIKGLIDEEFNEINIEKGACVELYYAFGSWYVVSSDGIKSN
jgi:carbamoylphosphate synthase large subunit